MTALNETKKNPLSSLYGNQISDCQSTDEESCEELSSSSESESPEDDSRIRSYHISSHCEGGLATIAEDAEEEEPEYSGHWMFSADSTDTDSVIHLPHPKTFGLPYVNPFKDDNLYSSSEDDLVINEDSVEESLCNLSNEIKSTHIIAEDNQTLHLPADSDERNTINSSASCNDQINDSHGDDSVSGESVIESATANSEDLFDFCSLEVCEAVSDSEDGLVLAPTAELAFTTSASSTPFANNGSHVEVSDSGVGCDRRYADRTAPSSESPTRFELPARICSEYIECVRHTDHEPSDGSFHNRQKASNSNYMQVNDSNLLSDPEGGMNFNDISAEFKSNNTAESDSSISEFDSTSEPSPTSLVSKRKIKRFRKSGKPRAKHVYANSPSNSESTDSEEEVDKARINKLTYTKEVYNKGAPNEPINGEELVGYGCLGSSFQGSDFVQALVSSSTNECQFVSSDKQVTARAETACRVNNLSEKYVLDPKSLEKLEEKLSSESQVFEAKLVRPHSIGDLRPYSSSESDIEEQVHVVSHGKITNGGNWFVSRIAKDSLNGDSGFEFISSTGLQKSRLVENKNILSEVIFRCKQANQKPRRHQSMYNPEIRTNDAEWQQRVNNSGMYVAKLFAKGRQRPKPLSIDLAKEFLHQEELSRYLGTHKSSPVSTDKINKDKAPPVVNTSGHHNVGVASVTPREVAVGGDTCESPFSEQMMHKKLWPNAHTASTQFYMAASPEYSSESQLFVRERDSNKRWDVPIGSSPLSGELASANNQLMRVATGIGSGQNGVRENSTNCDLTPYNLDMSGDCNRVRTKIYGAQGEVEVFLSKSNNMNAVAHLPAHDKVDERTKVGGKGVTFSPSVKEVNWRESYLEADDIDFNYTQLEEKEVRKVKVISSDNIPPIKCKPVLTNIKSETLNRTRSDNCANEFSKENSPANANGGKKAHTLPAVPSNAKERVSTPPIWQRLKLVKIGTPKGPRPQVPPKPASLSSRSCEEKSSSESGISSPELNSAKKTSPRFFSWGSKRDKRNNKNNDEAYRLAPEQREKTSLSLMSDNKLVDANRNHHKKVEINQNTALNLRNYPKENISPESMGTDEFDRTNNSVVMTSFGRNIKNNEYPVIATKSPHLTNGNSPATVKYTSSDATSPSAEARGNFPISTYAKPPLPPYLNRHHPNSLSKSKLLIARKQYFQRQNSLPANTPIKSHTPVEPVCHQIREPQMVINNAPLAPSYNFPAKKQRSAAERLKDRFDRFSKAARMERERLAKSTPDLSQFEAGLRAPSISIDSPTTKTSSPHLGSDGVTGQPSNPSKCPLIREESGISRSYRNGRASKPHLSEALNTEFARASLRARTRSAGVLETDLDTGASREVLAPKETNLDDLYKDIQNLLDSFPKYSSNSLGVAKERTKAKSLLQLDASSPEVHDMENSLTSKAADDYRAKSMEFLLDDDNRASVQVPENELQKEGERQLSGAELRIRRSLQRLDVPDWMKNAQTPQQGFLLRNRDYSSGNAGWSAFSSKTGSMTSLGSSRANTPSTKFALSGRLSTRRYGDVTSPSPTASISPPPSDKATTFSYPFSRWSTSRLNSGTTTPTGSLTSQRTASYSRQPYLGWRSNTSLASLGGSQSSLVGGTYLTPAERLAISLLPKQKTSTDSIDGGSYTGKINDDVQNSKVSDVHSSIKEVTSAIVHYCKESPSPRSSPKLDGRSTSPKRKVWVESSFVGTRPINSPDSTMVIDHQTNTVNGHQEVVGEARPSHTPGEYLMAR